MIEQLFRSYLIAYLFWLGIALGCLPLLMLHHLVGGARRDGQSIYRPPISIAERTRDRRLRPGDHVCVGGLGDVARAALVLDDLWNAFHRRPIARSARIRYFRRGAVVRLASRIRL